MICSKCGKEITPGNLFCVGCGTPVQQEPVNTTPKAEPLKVKEEPVKPAEPKQSVEDGVAWHKGTLVFWMTVLFGYTNVHHFLLAKTGGPLNKKSRFVLNWEGLATFAFAMLGLSLVYMTGYAIIGIAFATVLAIASIVHAWRHAFGKIYSYDHTLHLMGQKWKKVVCIVEAALILISLVLVIVLITLMPKMNAKSALSVIPVAEASWINMQDAYAVESGKAGDFTAIGYSAPSDENIDFFDVPATKRKDVRAIAAILRSPMHTCPAKTTFAVSVQVDPRNGKTQKFCWFGLRNAETGDLEEMPAELGGECLSLIPNWKNMCDGGLVQKFDDLFPAPLVEPLDMSEIRMFMEKARANEPTYETGYGLMMSSGIPKLDKVMAALSPSVQEIDSKTFQTQNFIFKEDSRKKKKVVWTAKSLRPIDECPEGSEWKITAMQKSRKSDYDIPTNFGYYVKSPAGCPKVKDMPEEIFDAMAL